jgi:hypothetical protein
MAIDGRLLKMLEEQQLLLAAHYSPVDNITLLQTQLLKCLRLAYYMGYSDGEISVEDNKSFLSHWDE